MLLFSLLQRRRAPTTSAPSCVSRVSWQSVLQSRSLSRQWDCMLEQQPGNSALVYCGAASRSRSQPASCHRLTFPPLPPWRAHADTSGTTGTPKGVLLTHRAVVAGVTALGDYINTSKMPWRSDDVYFSFLPLAHIYGRCACFSLLAPPCPTCEPAKALGGLGGRHQGLRGRPAPCPAPLSRNQPRPPPLQVRGGAHAVHGRCHRLLERGGQGHARRHPRLPGEEAAAVPAWGSGQAVLAGCGQPCTPSSSSLP